MSRFAGSQSARLHGKNVNIGHCMQTFQPNFVDTCHVIGTIDFYHFIPLLLTLTFWLHFLAHFATDQDEI